MLSSLVSSSESSSDSGEREDENSEGGVVRAKHRRQGKKLSTYSSAQELWALIAEDDKKDGSSPTGVIEGSFELGSEPDLTSPADSPKAEIRCSHPAAISNWRKFFKLLKRKSDKHLHTFPLFPVPKLSRKNNRSTKESPMLRDLYNFKSSLENFSLSELRAATDNFNRENIIGRGGYAEVYKGQLKNGKLVAIKRANKGTPDERTAGFLSELGIIAHVKHPNTAKLIGCCIEGGMHLVFQLSPMGSLASALHGSKGTLDWSKRYKIALGTADGLTYLHETCERRIIHRDIKADNILLTENFEPKICDFGLAKWLPRQWTHYNVSKFEGTFGYFAPEYFMHGIVDEKTDVYAFGILLLELITGRKAVDDQQQSVVTWAKPLLDENDITELLDPFLGDDYDADEVDRMALTASLCIEHSPILRPQMSQVVILLRGDEYVAECYKESQNPTHHRTYSNELCDAQEYNSTKLNNINRLREIALGS
ncbi:Receptor-like cytosolic serine/threonine-protein kinase RBK2 [Hibiscus syriacus]|uniref:non-specific serine/threonine protein kinase n=1 Tax=Hibiscus syriacus TaxID=106335 RepID=A0A6A2XQZ8_HIBSY|nr:Receptor-like cytosolic serine/threonine-protein kinase RBK2 [Hibiscus syriacus]